MRTARVAKAHPVFIIENLKGAPYLGVMESTSSRFPCALPSASAALELALSVQGEAPRFYGNSADACRFYNERREELNSKMQSIFKELNRQLRAQQELDDIVRCWDAFVDLLDGVLSAIQPLRQNLPECAKPTDFDVLLDLRRVALKRANYLAGR